MLRATLKKKSNKQSGSVAQAQFTSFLEVVGGGAYRTPFTLTPAALRRRVLTIRVAEAISGSGPAPNSVSLPAPHIPRARLDTRPPQKRP